MPLLPLKSTLPSSFPRFSFPSLLPSFFSPFSFLSSFLPFFLFKEHEVLRQNRNALNTHQLLLTSFPLSRFFSRALAFGPRHRGPHSPHSSSHILPASVQGMMFFAKTEELSKVKERVSISLELTPEVSGPCTILTSSSRVAPLRRNGWCKHDLRL